MSQAQTIKILKTGVHRLLVLMVVLFFGFPLFIMVTNALKPEILVNQLPPVWFFKPTLEHFIEVFNRYPFAQYMLNSAIVSVSATVLGFVFGLPLAYTIARFAQRKLITLILGIRMIPFICLLIPWFIMTQELGMLDSYPPLILTHLVFTIPYASMILLGFFEDIPRELEEAARIDGCSQIGTFFRIILPLALPGMLAAGIIAFTYSWNNFLFALVLTGSKVKTLPVAAYGFLAMDHMDWGGLCAAATLITAPVIIFVFFAQRYLVRGLMAGALK